MPRMVLVMVQVRVDVRVVVSVKVFVSPGKSYSDSWCMI